MKKSNKTKILDIINEFDSHCQKHKITFDYFEATHSDIPEKVKPTSESIQENFEKTFSELFQENNIEDIEDIEENKEILINRIE